MQARSSSGHRALAATEKQMNDTANDEERVRRNISSLNNVSGQQQQVQNQRTPAAEFAKHVQEAVPGVDVRVLRPGQETRV